MIDCFDGWALCLARSVWHGFSHMSDTQNPLGWFVINGFYFRFVLSYVNELQ